MNPDILRSLASAWLLLSASLAHAQSNEPPWTDYRIVDLTHSFDASTVYWPTEDGFELETGFDGITDGGYYYASNRFAAADHGGTHLDAPRHFAEGRQSAAEVPLDRLMGPACVLDISEAAAADPDYRLSISDIEAWERQHGRIAEDCIVLLNTGFARFWPDRERYLGTSLSGREGVANLHFPGYSEAAARVLAARGIAAVGIDTASIDYGQSNDFIVHRYLYDLNIPGFENIDRLDALPPTGAWIIALPMKIAGGSGAPLRMIALVPDRAEDGGLTRTEAAASTVPEDFADLQSIIPGIEVELRYFGSDNFVGRPIAGYQANVAYLTRAAATALGNAQRELATDGLALRILDAYRPQRAVRDFMAWAADPDATTMKSAYYPELDKSELIPEGYIAERSGHSRGSTVDLTLIDLDSGEELDMGSPYDFFDPASWPGSDRVSETAQRNRTKLREIMLRHGFEPLDEEWWHFTLRDEPYPDTYFDFPVR